MSWSDRSSEPSTPTSTRSRDADSDVTPSPPNVKRRRRFRSPSPTPEPGSIRVGLKYHLARRRRGRRRTGFRRVELWIEDVLDTALRAPPNPDHFYRPENEDFLNVDLVECKLTATAREVSLNISFNLGNN